jgi:hypothetical protein
LQLTDLNRVLTWLHARQGHVFSILDCDTLVEGLTLRGAEPSAEVAGDAEPGEYDLQLFKTVDVGSLLLRPSRLAVVEESPDALVLRLGEHELTIVDDGRARF